jgi:uncharacterized protein YfcZ (UPF0381/DUF406 family)
MATLDQQLEETLQRRKRVAAELERLGGRREQAQATLTAVEEEIRAKKIEPSKIDEKLQQLEDKYRGLVEDLTRDVAEAERAIAPFVKGNVNT